MYPTSKQGGSRSACVEKEKKIKISATVQQNDNVI